LRERESEREKDLAKKKKKKKKKGKTLFITKRVPTDEYADIGKRNSVIRSSDPYDHIPGFPLQKVFFIWNLVIRVIYIFIIINFV